TNQGRQLYKLGFDGSVTQWTATVNLDPVVGGVSFPVFDNAMWFNGTDFQGGQLYKLGFDGSVTKWTAINTGGVFGLNPQNTVEFANALWFSGNTGFVGGQQLFKLGADGSVTQWTAVPGGFDPQLVSQGALGGIGDSDSTPSSIFQNAAWLQGTSNATGTELYKLGADGSVTLWKDINPGVGSSNPQDWARLAQARWANNKCVVVPPPLVGEVFAPLYWQRLSFVSIGRLAIALRITL